MLHEAGYDSFLTGIVFGSMIKKIEVQHFLDYPKSTKPKTIDDNITNKISELQFTDTTTTSSFPSILNR